MNPTEIEIEEKYSAIYKKNGSPKWAVDIEPAIPFVGNDYYKMPAKCLIYGSAENLTYLSGNQISSNNYRRNREVKEAGNFFKNIHITPISDGSLLTVSRFILAKLGYDKQFSCDPRTFIEQVAISNFGKFSQNTNSNEDYAGKLKYLQNSFEFIKTDIGLLKPDIIVIPRTIHDFATIQRELLQSTMKIVPIYQTNLRVINRHLNNEVVNNNIYKFSFVNKWVDESITGLDIYLSWLDKQSFWK